MIGDCEVVEGMLKVQKQFRDSVVQDASWGQQASDKGANVMLSIAMTPELKGLGQSREITNRIQRLRKTSGISIEDQIEIFYEYAGDASPESDLGLVLSKHADKVAAQTKMPFGEITECTNPHQRLIGETQYVCQECDYDAEKMGYTWKEVPGEVLKLHIYLAGPKYNDDLLTVR